MSENYWPASTKLVTGRLAPTSRVGQQRAPRVVWVSGAVLLVAGAVPVVPGALLLRAAVAAGAQLRTMKRWRRLQARKAGPPLLRHLNLP
jgi:hypothetical protein